MNLPNDVITLTIAQLEEAVRAAVRELTYDHPHFSDPIVQEDVRMKIIDKIADQNLRVNG